MTLTQDRTETEQSRKQRGTRSLDRQFIGGEWRPGASSVVKPDLDMTHVNYQSVNDLAKQPFGGEKNSGIGRFGGDRAVQAFTTDHWVTISTSHGRTRSTRAPSSRRCAAWAARSPSTHAPSAKARQPAGWRAPPREVPS